MIIQKTETTTGSKVQLGNFEKAVVVCMNAFVVWMGTTVYLTSVRVAVIESQMITVASSLKDGYTRKDSEADKRAIDVRLDDLERRALRLETRTGIAGAQR